MIIFTEIMEIRILGKWKSRPATTSTRATGSLAPPKAESGKGSKMRTRLGYVGKARIMKWISRLLIPIVLALGYMCLQSAEGPGRLLFVCYNLALLLLWGLHELQHPLDEKKKG
jgi:hypothetical protein